MPLLQSKQENKRETSLKIHIFVIKRFAAIAIGIVALATGAGYFFFIKSPQQQFVERKARVREAEELYSIQSQVLIEKSKELKAMSFFDIQRLDILERIVPRLSTKEDLYIVITRVMQKKGLILNSMRFGSPRPFLDFVEKGEGKYFKEQLGGIQVPIQVIEVMVSVTDPSGPFGYQKVKEFFDYLSQTGRVFVVGRVSLGGEKELAGRTRDTGEDTTVNNFEISFDTFFLQDGWLNTL